LCEPQAQFSSGPGSFSVPEPSRRPNFPPVGRKRRVDTSQLIKGQSENCLTGRRFMFKAFSDHHFKSCDTSTLGFLEVTLPHPLPRSGLRLGWGTGKLPEPEES
jgi:hypothetical protein